VCSSLELRSGTLRKASTLMIAIQKNSFLEFEPVNLHCGTLSRSQSDSSLCRSSSSSSSMCYFFSFHSGQYSIARIERKAQARHDEVSVVVDAAKCHVGSHRSIKGDKVHVPHKYHRPDKKQRALFVQFLNEQKAKLAAQPHEFDIESVEIPASLWRHGGVKNSLEQVKKTLHELKTTLIARTRP